MREFIAKIDDYNARVYQAEQQLRALQAEHGNLRLEAGDYMRISAFDAEVATFTFPRFTFPESYRRAEPSEQGEDHAVMAQERRD
jgi:hypothetical protein